MVSLNDATYSGISSMYWKLAMMSTCIVRIYQVKDAPLEHAIREENKVVRTVQYLQRATTTVQDKSCPDEPSTQLFYRYSLVDGHRVEGQSRL